MSLRPSPPRFAASAPFRSPPPFHAPPRPTILRAALAVAAVLGLSWLCVLALSPDGTAGTQPSLAITLAGPVDVATASDVSCIATDGGVVARGTLRSSSPAPRGMTVYASLHPATGGVSIGVSATVSVPGTPKGAVRSFRGIISGTGIVPTSDRCVILWVADPAPS